jgi:hypothetical protein
VNDCENSYCGFNVAIFLAATNAFCAGTVKHYQIQTVILGESTKRTLSVNLPEDYDTSGASYPVLYLIHGANGNNLTFLGGGYSGWMSDANVSLVGHRNCARSPWRATEAGSMTGGRIWRAGSTPGSSSWPSTWSSSRRSRTTWTFQDTQSSSQDRRDRGPQIKVACVANR